MQLLALTSLLLSFAVPCAPGPLGQCACVPPGYGTPPEAALRARYGAADVVMLATALAAPEAGERAPRVRVDRVWKGAVTAGVVVSLDTMRETTCEVYLTPGVQYLVYASRRADDVLQVGRCSGTESAGASGFDLARLPALSHATERRAPKP